MDTIYIGRVKQKMKFLFVIKMDRTGGAEHEFSNVNIIVNIPNGNFKNIETKRKSMEFFFHGLFQYSIRESFY